MAGVEDGQAQVANAMEQLLRLPPLREDLELLPASSQPDGSPAWNLYDPLRHQFFRIGWREFEILSRWHLADAEAIAAEMTNSTTLAVTATDVLSVRQFLTINQLLSQTGSVQKPAASTSLLGLVSGFLYRRFPLLEPDTFLNATEPWSRFFFSRAFWWFTSFIAVLGFYLATRQWDLFRHGFSYFFTPAGVFTFSASVVVVKFLHELGHAYAAKRYGCNVPVIGAALIVFWPVFYTDTTDAWRLTDNRKRLVIGAAGVWIEIAVAIYATLLWSFLDPGPLRSVAFVLATTTWVTSLLVNLNP
ncbi:MAG: hypothetical protein OEL66_04520, partial [Desulfobulbaceae bacterium]|nr:hypothetical protein [Desulfobulbaceae bacterium]